MVGLLFVGLAALLFIPFACLAAMLIVLYPLIFIGKLIGLLIKNHTKINL